MNISCLRAGSIPWVCSRIESKVVGGIRVDWQTIFSGDLLSTMFASFSITDLSLPKLCGPTSGRVLP